MSTRQARIFVHTTEPQENWAENLIGHVVRPLAAQYADQLPSFWFSRYNCYDDMGDCDFDDISEACKSQDEHGVRHRSLRFRYSVQDDAQEGMEGRLSELVAAGPFSLSGCLDYNVDNDLGGVRFQPNHEEPTQEQRQRRSKLVLAMLESLSRMTLDSVEGPNAQGQYRCTTKALGDLHHMFCNVTAHLPTLLVRTVDGGVGISSPNAPARFSGSTNHNGDLIHLYKLVY